MHQKDYILRIIEQLGAVLAEIRRRILGKGVREGVRAELSDAAGRAGLDVDLLVGFDVETLRMLVSPAGDVEPARCWLMAEVLYLHGLEAVTADRPGRDSLLKARALYDLIRPFGGMLVGLPEATDRIAEIDALLADDGRAGRQTRRVRSRRARPRLPPRGVRELRSAPDLDGAFGTGC